MATTGYLKDKNGDLFYPSTHAAFTYTDWGTNVQYELTKLKNKSATWVGTRNEWDRLDKRNIDDGIIVVIADDGTYVYNKKNNKLILLQGSGGASAYIAYFNDTSDPVNAWKTITNKSADDGQILIIKTNTNDLQGYVWSEKDNTWYVFSGNVYADKVLFNEDILCAGDYEQVGNVNKTQKGTTTINSKGKSLMDVMETIFTKELQPSSPTLPSVSITLNQAGAYEVGTVLQPTYSASLSTGSYSYGPATGIVATGWSIVDSNGNTSTDNSGSFAGFTVEDTTKYNITATATYGNGAYAKTNLGNDTTIRIEAGSKSKISSSITGYRACFYGSRINPITINSDNIRNYLSAGNSKTFSMSVVEGATQVIIAYPGNVTLNKVLDKEAFGTDIKSVFVKNTVTIMGANGYTGKSYSVFVYSPATALGKNTYDVTIS